MVINFISLNNNQTETHMKKNLFAAMALLALAFGSKAQENHLNFGVGASGWGLPVYVSYDFNVAENWKVVVGGSFQQNTENFDGFGLSYKWQHTIIGLKGGAQYYFNELLNLDSQFDVYAAGTLGYYIWNTNYDGPGSAPDYSGSGSGGLGIGVAAGGRWHFTEKWSLNLEIGGGNVMSGALLGVSLKM